MIDSVVLLLPEGTFKLREYNQFDTTKSHRARGYATTASYCQKYTAQQKAKGRYFPSIQIPKKKDGHGELRIGLEIQASLPKSLHGTNLFEVEETDTESINEKHLGYLNEIGITTTLENVRLAILKRVDFSKVIKTPEYLGTAREIIHTLSRFNYKPQTRFRYRDILDGNNGAVMKFVNTTQGYAIYDKFGEILNQGHTTKEKQIIQALNTGKLRRNALKFELSLQRKDSLEAVLRRRIPDKKKNFHLHEVLKRELAQELLLNAFDEVFNNIAVGLISLGEMQENELLAYLEASGMSQKKQENLYYWVRMATRNGIAGTWEQLKAKHKGGSVGRHKRDIALALTELRQISGNTPNLIAFLREEHQKFEIIKPKPSQSITTIQIP